MLKFPLSRKAAGKWHPDKHQGVEEKKRAEQIFMHVAAGYEVSSFLRRLLLIMLQFFVLLFFCSCALLLYMRTGSFCDNNPMLHFVPGFARR